MAAGVSWRGSGARGVSFALLALGCACGEAPPPAPRPPEPPAPPEPTFQPLELTPASPPTPKEQLFELLGRLLGDEYAPGRLKRHELAWELEPELRRARAVFDRDPPASPRERQRALYELMGSPRDIHTSVGLGASVAVWLGVHVSKVADGSYRVAWRDPVRAKGLALSVGDRVESIDGVPIGEAIAAVTRETLYRSTPSFEQAFAEWFLVLRSQENFRSVPAVGASAVVGVRSARDKTPRKVSVPWLDYEKSPPSERCPFWGKTKQGYLPELGPVVWRSAPEHPFTSYVFAIDGLTWGYARFHSYALGGNERQAALEGWKAALAAFKKHKVRGLVLDQLGNGGGNFLFAYELFSRLVSEPLRVPIQHYMVAKDQRVAGFGDAAYLRGHLAQLTPIASDETAATFLGNYPLFRQVDFLPRNLETVTRLKGFFTVLAEQAKTGTLGLTEPLPSLFSEITPHPDALRYTGPLVVLIDGMNISAAEYAVAALGDAGRAELVGVGTAGAGGDQRTLTQARICSKTTPNPFEPCVTSEVAGLMKELGVTSLSHTVTLGRRVDGAGRATTYIENRGVAPTREHRLTATDLTGGFRDFKRAILGALK